MVGSFEKSKGCNSRSKQSSQIRVLFRSLDFVGNGTLGVFLVKEILDQI